MKNIKSMKVKYSIRKSIFLIVSLFMMFFVSASNMTYATTAAYPISYQLTGNQALDVVGVAKTQVGYKNGYNNDTCYGAWYGCNNNPWCAMFVSWCERKAGVSQSVVPNMKCADRSFYQNSGLYKKSQYRGGNYIPKAGDLIFLDTDYDGRDWSDHIGIVKSANATYVYTVEGNSGGAVKEKSYSTSSKWILGYGTPRYVDNSIKLKNEINFTTILPEEGIVQGTELILSGNVKSNCKVGSVTATVEKDGEIIFSYDSGSMSVSSYDIAKMNDAIRINDLASGEYVLTINMVNCGTSTVKVTRLSKTYSFTIVSNEDNEDSQKEQLESEEFMETVDEDDTAEVIEESEITQTIVDDSIKNIDSEIVKVDTDNQDINSQENTECEVVSHSDFEETENELEDCSDSPQTGDSNSLTLACGLLLIATSSLIALIIILRKKLYGSSRKH